MMLAVVVVTVVIVITLMSVMIVAIQGAVHLIVPDLVITVGRDRNCMVAMRIAALTVLGVLLVRDLLFGSWVQNGRGFRPETAGAAAWESWRAFQLGQEHFSLGRSIFGAFGIE